MVCPILTVLFPGAVSAGELGDGADPPTFQLRYRLLSHTSEEAEVVLAHGLEVALLSVFTDLAVVVEEEVRWRSYFEASFLISSRYRLACLGPALSSILAAVSLSPRMTIP